MKSNWTENDCLAIMSLLGETQNTEQLTFYQPLCDRKFMVVKCIDIAMFELRKLENLNIFINIFAEGSKLELWMSKND